MVEEGVEEKTKVERLKIRYIDLDCYTMNKAIISMVLLYVSFIQVKAQSISGLFDNYDQIFETKLGGRVKEVCETRFYTTVVKVDNDYHHDTLKLTPYQTKKWSFDRHGKSLNFMDKQPTPYISISKYSYNKDGKVIGIENCYQHTSDSIDSSKHIYGYRIKYLYENSRLIGRTDYTLTDSMISFIYATCDQENNEITIGGGGFSKYKFKFDKKGKLIRKQQYGVSRDSNYLQINETYVYNKDGKICMSYSPRYYGRDSTCILYNCYKTKKDCTLYVYDYTKAAGRTLDCIYSDFDKYGNWTRCTISSNIYKRHITYHKKRFFSFR